MECIFVNVLMCYNVYGMEVFVRNVVWFVGRVVIVCLVFYYKK